MSNPLMDNIARAIFTAALTEDRCGELLECLFDGGSATVDAKTGLLVLASQSMLNAMRGDSDEDDSQTGLRDSPSEDAP